MKDKKVLKVLCEYCKDLVPVTISAKAEILSDYDSTGPEIGVELTVKCDLCEHSLFRVKESGFCGETEVNNKGGDA